MKPQIVFFGTGPVSLSCLEGVDDAFEIEAIITKPDRVSPSGKPHAHPVRSWGAAHQLPVHSVAGKQELAELIQRHSFSSRLGLVVDFGVIIPREVIASFELGIVNSHFSLLPQLRGADPISFAILEGLPETGVSLMQIVPALDEGNLLAQEKLATPPHATTSVLTQELSKLSNRLLHRELPRYAAGQIKPWPQSGAPTYTRRLTKSDGLIDWTKPAIRLEREVRAFLGWPGSRTTLWGQEVTVTAATVSVTPEAAHQPGTILEGHPNRLLVATGDGVLELLCVKPAGRREMDAAAFLRGRG